MVFGKLRGVIIMKEERELRDLYTSTIWARKIALEYTPDQ
jgi:hypothetical protein